MSDNPLHNPVIFLICDKDNDIGRLKDLVGIDNIFVFTAMVNVGPEFASRKPDILIFSCRDLSVAERLYFDLFKSTSLSEKFNHRSIVLCNDKDSQRAYTLCSKGYFDDYVIFWPEVHDRYRIQIIIQHLLHDLEKRVNQDMSLINRLMSQVRQLAGVDDVIEKQIKQGSEFIAGLKNEIASAQIEISKTIENTQKSKGWIASMLSSKNKVDAKEVTEWNFQNIDKSMKPLDNWVNDFNDDLDSHLQTIKSIDSIARQIKRRILVIDDDEFQLKIAANILSQKNEYQVECVSDWHLGLNILNDYIPDLIIMDYKLPEVSGLELLLNITEDPRFSHIPFIMSTGTTDVDVVNTSFTAGVSAYLVKPYKRKALLAKVSEALNRELAT